MKNLTSKKLFPALILWFVVFILPIYAQSSLSIFPPIGDIVIPTDSIYNERIPESFETKRFSILRKIYISKNTPEKRELFNQKLFLTVKPSTALVKYKPINSVPRKIEFQNEELWLYVFDKTVSKLLFVISDDWFDGFIYEGKDADNLVDRVGIIDTQSNLKWLNIRKNVNNQSVVFNLPNGREVVLGTLEDSIDKISYKKYWNIAITTLKEESNNFVPFGGTADILSQ